MPIITSEAFFTGLRRPQLGVCLCWDLIPQINPPLHFTNHDKPLTVSGTTYIPTSSFSGSAVTGRSGLSVDNMNVVGITSDDITDEDLLAGVYDEAEVYVYMLQWEHPERGLHVIKRGWLGEVKVNSSGGFDTEVRGIAEYLQRANGRTYSLECNADFGDSRCTVDLTPFTFSTTVVSTNTDKRTFLVPLSEPDDVFQYGTCRFLTGPNAGRRIEVLGSRLTGDNTEIILLGKMPFDISTGDTLELVQGCAKTKAACSGYNNLINMRGFPDMPTEATVLETPNAKN